MAYPTIDAPYGFKPVNLIGGLPFAGQVRRLPIQYGYATDLFTGDLVQLARGFVTKSSPTTSGTGLGLTGVFLGVEYTDPTLKYRLFSNKWTASTLAGDAMAYVVDDPNTVFKAVVCSSGTTVASGSKAMVGQNYSLIQNSGDSNTGVSRVALLYSATLTTAAFPCRVVGVCEETKSTVTATGSSSSTTITLTGSGLPSAIVAGTHVAYVASNGQIIDTGSFVTTAAAAAATSVTINSAIAVPGGVTAIPSSSTILFTQYPEMLVKLNALIHEYNTATAV